MDPNGKFAYLANQTSNTISSFTIDPSTGALISAGAGTDVLAGAGPTDIVIATTHGVQ